MRPSQPDTGLSEVAARTVTAAHRRDHVHDDPVDLCLPHAVEVVYLRDLAVLVCHDCRYDSGFIAHRDAEHMASEHRLLTAGVVSTEPDTTVSWLGAALPAAAIACWTIAP